MSTTFSSANFVQVNKVCLNIPELDKKDNIEKELN